jgi:uncharacterized protein YjiS (DUF1127 family)
MSVALMNSHSEPRALAARIAAATQALANTLHVWGSRIRERQSFPLINDRELHDLGVSRWELERELSKPFWRD